MRGRTAFEVLQHDWIWKASGCIELVSYMEQVSLTVEVIMNTLRVRVHGHSMLEAAEKSAIGRTNLHIPNNARINKSLNVFAILFGILFTLFKTSQ